MAKKIASLLDLSSELAKSGVLLHNNLHKAIAEGTKLVHVTAVNKFGKYQPQFGEYPAWLQLKKATIARKANAGGGEDPLIGHYEGKGGGKAYPTSLRNSILIKTSGLIGIVGTNNPLAPHHEYGAPKRNIPPRPFLRPALHENEDHIKNLFKEAIAKTLIGL